MNVGGKDKRKGHRLRLALLSLEAQVGAIRIGRGLVQDAHRLYRALGFQEREAYPESEIPPGFHANWTFMERKLHR